LMSARQARRLVDAISAAKAKLDDAGEGLLASDVVPGRYSGVHSRAEIILGVSYITLGISVVALCVWIVARNSLLRRSQS
jgi:hypothetical protein